MAGLPYAPAGVTLQPMPEQRFSTVETVADGSVGEVRVLRGVDDRLDAYARAALTHWRFQPATKNGNAVDLEAVVAIPFRVSRTKSGF